MGKEKAEWEAEWEEEKLDTPLSSFSLNPTQGPSLAKIR